MSLWNKLFGGPSKLQKNHTEDSPEEIRQLISNGEAIMLDVRSQQEFDDGHLKQVTFINISEIKDLPESATELNGLDKNSIIYCH